MVNIQFYLREPKATKFTGINLFVSIRRRGRFKVCTVDQIIPKYWDDKKHRARNTNSFPEHVEFNTRLEQIESKAKLAIRQLINDNNQVIPDQETLKTTVLNSIYPNKKNVKGTITDFIDFVEQFIKDCKNGQIHNNGRNLQPSTIKTFNTLWGTLKEFKKKYNYNTSFKSITTAFYDDLKAFMVNHKKYSTNSLGKYLKTFKRIWDEANFRGLTALNFQGHRFKTPSEQTISIYLNQDELKLLEELDLSKKPSLDNVRDFFLLGCNTGLRFSDLERLKKSDIKNGKIQIRTKKTDTEVVIPINSQIKKILDKYIHISSTGLPSSISNQKMNKHLKELCQIAGLNELIKYRITKGGETINKEIPKYECVTTHTARRSFATNRYLSGLPIPSIMKITGHTTESSFMKYLRATPLEHANILSEHYKLNGEL